MSNENVEIVRGHFEDTNARRFDAAMQTYDPKAELVVSEDVAIDPGTYRGADAVGEWFGSWFRTFAPGYQLDITELIPVDDAVVVAVDHRAVGRRSGVEVTTRYYNAYWIKDDKIVRLELFRERSEALEAVGLRAAGADPAPEMPGGQVDVVRDYFTARRQKGREGVFELLSPDVVWTSRTDLPDTQVYTGHDGVRKLFSRFRDVMDDMWFEPDDFIVVSDRVVVSLRWGGRGKGSGVPFEEREAWVFTVSDGIIVRVEEYGTREAALEAAGIED
jgi:ketosteroid isomerase-like protein